MTNTPLLEKFLRDSVRQFKVNDFDGTFRFILDADLAVYVGWGSGFCPDENILIHSKNQPEYCVCAKVAENIPNFAEYEWVNMPWDKDGDVYDSEITIWIEEEDYSKLAKSLYRYYQEIRRGLDTGELTF